MEETRLDWAACIDRSQAGALARIRNWPGLMFCHIDNLLWVKGQINQNQIEVWQSIPFSKRYTVDETLLYNWPNGKLITHVLPNTEWLSLREHWSLCIIKMSSSIPNSSSIQIQLIQNPKLTHANAWLGSVFMLEQWIDSAPEVRMKNLKFAIQDNEALIFGEQLPSFPGQFFSHQENVLLPLGHQLLPQCSMKTLRKIANIDEQSLLLIRNEKQWESIPFMSIVPLSRSSWRLSKHE